MKQTRWPVGSTRPPLFARWWLAAAALTTALAAVPEAHAGCTCTNPQDTPPCLSNSCDDGNPSSTDTCVHSSGSVPRAGYVNKVGSTFYVGPADENAEVNTETIQWALDQAAQTAGTLDLGGRDGEVVLATGEYRLNDTLVLNLDVPNGTDPSEGGRRVEVRGVGPAGFEEFNSWAYGGTRLISTGNHTALRIESPSCEAGLWMTRSFALRGVHVTHADGAGDGPGS